MPIQNTFLVVQPSSPYNLGTQVVSVALNGNIVLKAVGAPGSVNWTLISNSNPAFVIGPPTSGSLDRGDPPFNVPVTITEAVAGPYTTTAIIQDTDNGISHTLVINASFVTAGSTLIANPTSVAFPNALVGDPPQTQVVVISNNSGAGITVTAVNMKGLPFSCLTATPFVVPNAGTFNITLQAIADFAGSFSGSATLKSILPDLVIPLTVTVFFLNSVDILGNKTRAVLLGLGLYLATPPIGPPVTRPARVQQFDGSSFDFSGFSNFDLASDSTTVFNGALWDNPGSEKTLHRLEVFYENVGICTGLKLDISVWRPSLTPPGFDSMTQTISLGDASADLSERTTFFDVDLSGELIIAKITRLSATGAVSILGFTPHFEDRGEKVENV
jgi:hypothetical protein